MIQYDKKQQLRKTSWYCEECTCQDKERLRPCDEALGSHLTGGTAEDGALTGSGASRRDLHALRDGSEELQPAMLVILILAVRRPPE